MSELYPKDAVILAPLAGFTDQPYRLSVRRHGCYYAFCEMVDAGSLVYGTEKTLRFLERHESEPWLGAQLVGADHDHLAKATAILEQYDFDVLDFNLGCPAPKVVKKGEGSALAEDADAAARCLELIVKLSTRPVTTKTRIQHEQDPTPTINLAKKLVDAGAQLITIHGRVRKKFYSGPVFHDIIAAVREAISVPVIANGGVKDFRTYEEIRQATGCNLVMVATGAMGNPWLFRELDDPANYRPPTVAELADEMEKHILNMVDYYGEEYALKVGRKVILDYMGGRGFPGKLKAKVSFVCTVNDFAGFMEQVRCGPSYRYWNWLETQDTPERRLTKE